MKLTEAYVDSLAPNQSAIQNARGLVRNKSLVNLGKTPDGAVLFGECLGSAEQNYRLSADFLSPESPAFHCSCPSRQFPCKHVLGLLYAFAAGTNFPVREIPAEVAAARDRARQKAERQAKRRESPAAPPKKVNRSALAKKIQAQLQGLDLLDKLLLNVVRSGLGSLDARAVQILDEQARQLGDYYLPGAQDAWQEFIWEFKRDAPPEEVYARALPRLTRLYALVRKGREHLAKKEADPEGYADLESPIEELLGHAWQLEELRARGRVQTDVELLQLSFTSYAEEGRQEYVDAGLWLNLRSGEIQQTLNYRPFRAAKHIREDDSFYGVAAVKELCVYPGYLNPRIRWDESTLRDTGPGDFQRALEFARASFAEAVKSVKNQIKNPLADKNPCLLLRYARLGSIDGLPVIEAAGGERLILGDLPGGPEPPTAHLLPLLPAIVLTGGAVLARFHHDLADNVLRIQPLTFVTTDRITRLAY